VKHWWLQLALALPVASHAQAVIPANELRTHADTIWILGAAARTLPRDRILGVGGVHLAGNLQEGWFLRSRQLLPVVAQSLHLPFDSTRIVSDPPPCPNDTSATQPRGYRIESASIEQDGRTYRDGPRPQRPQWFHYVVDMRGWCRLDGQNREVATLVRFDAVPDTTYAFSWAVADVRPMSNPERKRSAASVAASDRRMRNAFDFLAFAALLFPPLGFLAWNIGRQRGLAWLYALWSIAGLAAAIGVGESFSLLEWFLPFELPAAAYILAALPKSSSSPFNEHRFLAAALALIVTYAVALALFWLLFLNGFVG
jgi:hypothetical protein